MKILVVDDEYKFCKTLQAFLVRKGHDVTIAMNGEHALDLLREEKPDLMTLDIRMPGVNGHEVLEALRKEGNPVKVVVVSAIDMPEMEKRLLDAGAWAVLRKSVDLELLVKTIEDFAR